MGGRWGFNFDDEIVSTCAPVRPEETVTSDGPVQATGIVREVEFGRDLCRVFVVLAGGVTWVQTGCVVCESRDL
jgi:hypothetical protein